MVGRELTGRFFRAVQVPLLLSKHTACQFADLRVRQRDCGVRADCPGRAQPRVVDSIRHNVTLARSSVDGISRSPVSSADSEAADR